MLLATKYPIELIVFTFVLTTLAYFHTLHQIKHSEFFKPFHPPVHLGASPILLSRKPGDTDWVNVDVSTHHSHYVDILQLVFPPTATSQSIANFTSYIFSLKHNSSILSSVHNAQTSTLALALNGHYSYFFNALTNPPTPFGPDAQGLTFTLPEASHTAADYVNIASMKSGRWVAYAFRALIIRLWDLTMKADSLDIYTVLLGYILMHITFLSLPLRARTILRSKPSSLFYRNPPYLWLSLAILSSSILSFILALPLSQLLRISIDPICLSEALPFFVITVGFDKPLRMARAVFAHPRVLGASASSSGASTSVSSGTSAAEVVSEAISDVASSVLRDYAIEVGVLVLGAASNVRGVKEFCGLAAVILLVDCISLFGFYVAVLSIMVEVQRLNALRFNATPSSAFSPSRIAEGVSQEPNPSKSILSNGSSSSTPAKIYASPTIDPVPRLKLLLLISFITLHVLNLLNTLSPASAHLRFEKVPSQTQLSSTPKAWSVVGDVTSESDSSSKEGVQLMGWREEGWLEDGIDLLLAQVMPTVLTDVLIDSASGYQQEQVIKVHASLHLTLATSPVHKRPGFLTVDPHTWAADWGLSLLKTWSRRLRSFSLSSLVGDPLLSKWIVLALALSFSLNGVLLKGLGAVNATSDRERVKERLKEREQNKNLSKKGVTFAAGFLPPSVVVDEVADEKKREGNVKELPIDLTDAKGLRAPIALHCPSPLPVLSTPAPFPDSFSEVQTEEIKARSLEECLTIYSSAPSPALATPLLTNVELVSLVEAGHIPAYGLEKVMPSEMERAVAVRRSVLGINGPQYGGIPYQDYDYSKVLGACCENVVGYIPIPLGIAGPLIIDGRSTPIPMATAEGTLVASTSRGCKALNAGGGVTTVLTQDVMTRGPAISFPSVTSAANAKLWIESEEGGMIIRSAFESTSRFAKLQRVKSALAGRTLYVRFATSTGDAMGMNMISKGVEKALEAMAAYFPDMHVLALSGNYCTDKKSAAINWIEGRGKSVVAECVVPGKVVKTVLKTTVADLVNLNVKKNLVGSAMAGAMGGFNAHAANILTAMFLATGQDPAQNVESSNCITLMEGINGGEDLLVTVTMPSIEVGTVGGGTVLTPQASILKFLGIYGAHPTHPGHNARQLARVIAAAVMAGELSLMSALAAGHLIKAHMSMNRTPSSTPMSTRPSTPALSSFNISPVSSFPSNQSGAGGDQYRH